MVKSGDMMDAKGALEVFKKTENLPSDTIIFFDVDDTLIRPQSRSFTKSPNMIDEIKANKDRYQNFIEILSNWRLQRKITLMDYDWPIIVAKLKTKFRIYGLTKMDTGSFGNIKSIEDWRYRELKSLGIEFSDDIKLPNITSDTSPVFYKGIFITGSVSKSQTLEKYKTDLKTSTIVMVDDRVDHLEDIQIFCKKESINFVGILYRGHNDAKFDEKLAQFQKEYLIKHAIWLEDREALSLMSK